ncbi:uncharacterized protein TM35_000381720, partial [Trypanosoma theileri]
MSGNSSPSAECICKSICLLVLVCVVLLIVGCLLAFAFAPITSIGGIVVLVFAAVPFVAILVLLFSYSCRGTRVMPMCPFATALVFVDIVLLGVFGAMLGKGASSVASTTGYRDPGEPHDNTRTEGILLIVFSLIPLAFAIAIPI